MSNLKIRNRILPPSAEETSRRLYCHAGLQPIKNWYCSRGVDVGAKQEIYDNLKRLAAQGVGIIIFSSETDELLSSSDRILIMYNGEIAGNLPNTADLDEKTVGLYMLGGKKDEA